MVLSALASEGVVRVRVEDYEKLLASMHDEAEARVAAATEEARAAKEESASLRARLDEAEAREAESLARFQSWRDALVDTAADELAAESASWRAVVASMDEEIVALNALASELDAAAAQAAEREAHHIARADALEARIAAGESAGARVEDGTASVDATRGDRRRTVPTLAAASDAAASDAAGRSIRPRRPLLRTARDTGGRGRSRTPRRWRCRRRRGRGEGGGEGGGGAANRGGGGGGRRGPRWGQHPGGGRNAGDVVVMAVRVGSGGG